MPDPAPKSARVCRNDRSPFDFENVIASTNNSDLVSIPDATLPGSPPALIDKDIQKQATAITFLSISRCGTQGAKVMGISNSN
jgi:hypothetical protein